MYDYKLYVSLLIFVYSLMDSDERASLQKKMCVFKKNCQTCLMNTLFNVSLTVKKYKPLIFVSCDISLQACGGWAGSSQNCGCRIFNFMVARFRAAPITEKGCEAFQTATQTHHRFWTAKVLCWGSVCFGIGFTVCFAWLLYGSLI